MKPRKKKVLSGSKKTKVIDNMSKLGKHLDERVDEVVSSKIEITEKLVSQNASLHAYRKSIKDMTKDVKKYALSLSPENLLSVKMSLMGAVRDVEDMIKERRRKG